MPSPTDKFVVYTDASGVGVGGCLHAVRGSEEFPVAFFSSQLRGTEKNYSITELESLALVSSVCHFEHYLYGQSFVACMDHKPCFALISAGQDPGHISVQRRTPVTSEPVSSNVFLEATPTLTKRLAWVHQICLVRQILAGGHVRARGRRKKRDEERRGVQRKNL